MKKTAKIVSICLTMVFALLLLSGCAPSDEAGRNNILVESEQTDVSRLAPSGAVEQTNLSDTEATTEDARDFSTPENTVPMLISTRGNDNIHMYYSIWSLSDGALSEAEEWLTATDDGSLLVGMPVFWNGSGRVVTYTEPTATAAGIVPEKLNTYALQHFGSTAYQIDNTGTAYFLYTAPDGTTLRLEIPNLSVPEEYAEYGLLSRNPHLADLKGDEMTLVYMLYDGVSMEGDLYYVTYDIDNEASARWGTAHVPLAYAADIDINWNFCRVGDSVYMAAFDTVVVLELDSGKLHTLGSFDSFRETYPDYTAARGGEPWEIEISGNWNGFLVVSYSFTEQSGNERSLFLVLDESYIAGIMEYMQGDIFLYDGEMHLLHHEDGFAGKTTFHGVNFPFQ